MVDEERLYSSWTDNDDKKPGQVNLNSGIIKGKRLLNDLHLELAKSGFNEVRRETRLILTEFYFLGRIPVDINGLFSSFRKE